MTDYTKVYDPSGALFEIPHERAALLVLNAGWSWKPKETVVESAPVASAPAPEPATVHPAVEDIHAVVDHIEDHEIRLN